MHNWIPVDSILCVVRLKVTARTLKDRNAPLPFPRFYLSPTGCSSDGVKYKLCTKLNDLKKVRASNGLVVASGHSVQGGRISQNEKKIKLVLWCPKLMDK